LNFAGTLRIMGGLVPIIKATLHQTEIDRIPFDFGQAGYLLIAEAAGCVGLDRFFGYSTGWIRYITTAMAIEKSLEEYRMEWARNIAKLRGAPPNS
jgi:SMODS and SLOG-associating 2TM effector domain 2